MEPGPTRVWFEASVTDCQDRLEGLDEELSRVFDLLSWIHKEIQNLKEDVQRVKAAWAENQDPRINS